jgi:hypothetical protein
MTRRSTFRLCMSSLLTAFALGVGGAAAGPEAPPRIELSTNQSYVEALQRRPALPLERTRDMFSAVLGSLPDKVTVYPTENYYYFNFLANGIRYAGNIRLDASTRDLGKLHFAYFPDLQEWSGSEQVNYMVLDQSHGVSVTRIGVLLYLVKDGDREVRFQLNDLRGVAPPAASLLPGERYIGPIFDESAIRFFLVFNEARKVFHYILDETGGVDDQLEPSILTDRVLIGRRTGFAYYRDHRTDRKILIGVHEANARVNNYFDGPFDQLPDNFIEGENLRSAILDVEPSLRGQIDRYGAAPDGSSRYMIAPYRHYTYEDELMYFHNCATWPKLKSDVYPSCFVYVELPPDTGRNTPPRKGRNSKRR